jgi:hypothetical protein
MRAIPLLSFALACGAPAEPGDFVTAKACHGKIGNCSGNGQVADVEGSGPVLGILEGVDTLANAFAEISNQSSRRADLLIELADTEELLVVPTGGGDAVRVNRWDLGLTLDGTGVGHLTGWVVDDEDEDVAAVVGDIHFAGSGDARTVDIELDLTGSSAFYEKNNGAAGTRIGYINSDELWEW